MAEIYFYGANDRALHTLLDFGYDDLKSKVNGDYNKGELLFSGGKIHRINNHVTFTAFNHRTTNEVENTTTRRAIYALIQDKWETSLGENNDVYQEVKRQLVGNPSLLPKPISRDEVRFMLNLLESEKARQNDSQHGMDASDAHRQLEISRGLKVCTPEMREVFAKTRTAESMRQFVKGWRSDHHAEVNERSSNREIDTFSNMDGVKDQLTVLMAMHSLVDEANDDYIRDMGYSPVKRDAIWASRASIDQLFGSVFGRGENAQGGLEADRDQLLRFKGELGVGQVVTVNGREYDSEAALVRDCVGRIKEGLLSRLDAGCDAALDESKTWVRTEAFGAANDPLVRALDEHIAGKAHALEQLEKVKNKLIGARMTSISQQLGGLDHNAAQDLIDRKTKDLKKLFADLEGSLHADVPADKEPLAQRLELFERKSAAYKQAMHRRAAGLLDQLFDGCTDIDALLSVRESCRPFFDSFDTGKAKELVKLQLIGGNQHKNNHPLFLNTSNLQTGIRQHSEAREKWTNLICGRLATSEGVEDLKRRFGSSLPDFQLFETMRNSLSERSDVLSENDREYYEMFVKKNIARFHGFLGSGNLESKGLGTNLGKDSIGYFDVDEALLFGSEYALQRGLHKMNQLKSTNAEVKMLLDRFTERLWSAYHAVVPRRKDKATGEWMTLNELPAGFRAGQQIEYARQLLRGQSPTRDGHGVSTEKSWEKVKQQVVETRKKDGATRGAVMETVSYRAVSTVEDNSVLGDRKDLIAELKKLLLMVGEHPDRETKEQVEQ